MSNLAAVRPKVTTASKGMFRIIIAAALWGIGGTAGQILMQQRGVPVEWLIAVRQLVAGLLLLVMSAKSGQTFRVWKESKDRFQLLVYGIVGMLGVQYTFFACIETGNAATATLLQYTCPIVVVLYLALRLRKAPTRLEIASVFLAMLGTYLLVTDGASGELNISPLSLWWGIGASVTAAFYTIYPGRLLSRWDSTVVVGWAMFIGGATLSLLKPIWFIPETMHNFSSIALLLFIIIFGTLVAFYMYIDALRQVSPTQATVLSSTEPLSSAILAVILFQTAFGFLESMGALLIIGTVIMLSAKKKQA